jgi:hypothetical protein
VLFESFCSFLCPFFGWMLSWRMNKSIASNHNGAKNVRGARYRPHIANHFTASARILHTFGSDYANCRVCEGAVGYRLSAIMYSTAES